MEVVRRPVIGVDHSRFGYFRNGGYRFAIAAGRCCFGDHLIAVVRLILCNFWQSDQRGRTVRRHRSRRGFIQH